MFRSKAKKNVEVKSEDKNTHKINVQINIKPLVTIEKHESRINGKVQAPEFRISIGGRDVLMVNSREYNELFMEMLRRMDNDEIMHALYEVHAEAHNEEEKVGEAIEEMLNKSGLGAALKKFAEQH